MKRRTPPPRISPRPNPALSDEQVQAILDGTPIADLPDLYLPVVPVLAAARRLPDEIESGDDKAARAIFASARPPSAGSAQRGARLGGRIGILSTIAVLASGASAAAATGSLPPAVQRDTSHWLSNAGIHIPSPDRTLYGAGGGFRANGPRGAGSRSQVAAVATTTSTRALPDPAAPTSGQTLPAVVRPAGGGLTGPIPTTTAATTTTVPGAAPATTSPTSTTAPVTTTTTTPPSTTTSLPAAGSSTTAP